MTTRYAALATTAVLLLAGGLLAEEAAKPSDGEAMFPGLQSEVQVTGIGYAGPANTAKWEEYRDLSSSPVVADWLMLDYENTQKTYDFDLRVKRAGLEDMNLLFTGEKYGVFKVTFEFNRIPHRFLSDVGTLYSGLETEAMRIPDSIQADLSAIGAPGTIAAQQAVMARMRTDLHDGNQVDEVSLQRDQYNLSLAFIQLAPFTAGIDIRHEERYGGRPIGAAFNSFFNAVGLVEPIDYGTTDTSIWTAYDQGILHLKVFYGFDYFDNRIGSFQFDNPFRATDAFVAVGGNIWTSGPRQGNYDLYPDNQEHRVGFEVGVDAPAKTRITTGFTATWRQTSDDLQAYSSNSALLTTGLAPNFDTSNEAFLPQEGFDGDVTTQRATFGLTNHAIDRLTIRARYRYYALNNDSDEIEFPGFALEDSTWRPIPTGNELFEYDKHDAGLEFAYDIAGITTATLGYRFMNMHRDNRNVDSMWDHTFLCAVDSAPEKGFGHRISYEHTWRSTDDYEEPDRAQLPFLRRYDEVEYDRDKLNAQFTYVTDVITPTAGYTLLFTDYDTNFGVEEETRNAVNAGIDSDPCAWMHASLTGNLEWYDGNQQSRQWSPFNPATPGAGNGIGDPFFTDTGELSFSNWEAHLFDRVVTFNAALDFTLITDKLGLETSYTFMHAGEQDTFDSPIGNPVGPTAQSRDNNPRDETLFGLSDGDNSTWNNARVQFRWHVRKNFQVVFGYLFEKFDHEDYRWRGFTAVPSVNSTGAYAGLLSLNRDPEDYESHAGFVSVIWSF